MRPTLETEPGPMPCGRFASRFARQENPNYRQSEENGCPVRGMSELSCAVPSCPMARLMESLLPQEAARSIVHRAPIGQVDGRAIPPVIVSKFCEGECAQRRSRHGRPINGGRAQTAQGPPSVCGKALCHERSHERRSLALAHEVPRGPFTEEFREPGFVFDFLVKNRE